MFSNRKSLKYSSSGKVDLISRKGPVSLKERADMDNYVR